MNEKKKTSKFNKSFIESYNKNSDIVYIFEVGVEYLKHLHNLHNDPPFLPEKKTEKKLVITNNFYNKEKLVVM